jgi:hypothetical protein
VVTYIVTIVRTKAPTSQPTPPPVASQSSSSETTMGTAALSSIVGGCAFIVLVGGFYINYRYKKKNEDKGVSFGDDYDPETGTQMVKRLANQVQFTNVQSSASSKSSANNSNGSTSSFRHRQTTVDFGGEELSGAYHIPFTALKLESKPFARGGGGQIFKGHYRATTIAAKQVFSNLTDEGNLEEFEREVAAVRFIL